MLIDNKLLDKVTESFLLDPLKGVYGVQIPAGQWHTLEVLESSVIFEVKDGPYRPLGEGDVMKLFFRVENFD